MTKFVKKYTKDQLIYLPRFDVTMAAHFFDLTPGALKQRERAGQFIDQKGIEIQPVRMPGGSRRYSIDAALAMAKALRDGIASPRSAQCRIATCADFPGQSPFCRTSPVEEGRGRSNNIARYPCSRGSNRFEFSGRR